MIGIYKKKKFGDCLLGDPFFDTLKKDYPGFIEWFNKKSGIEDSAFVYEDDFGISAFVYLKREEEEIELIDEVLPRKKRIKIGTLKLDERQQGRRLGEGAIGISLWGWQKSGYDEIYLTVFESHEDIIKLVEKYGFRRIGEKENGELVYLKDRNDIDYSDPFKAFPFINPYFESAGLLPMYYNYHDRLLPYSELKNTTQEYWEEAAGNGITKIYVGSPKNIEHFKKGTPVFIYRIAKTKINKGYKSCITSFATISEIYVVKKNGVEDVNKEKYLKICGNKTIFKEVELLNFYKKDNVVVFELVYNGVFGKDNNVIYNDLKKQGLFNTYPYDIIYSKKGFKKILEMGGKDSENIIID